MVVDEATKKRIDAWIKAEGRNDFGDPQGTNYAGGTPLFDMRTGVPVTAMTISLSATLN